MYNFIIFRLTLSIPAPTESAGLNYMPSDFHVLTS